MNINKLKRQILCMALFAFSLSAQATMITFEEFGIANDDGFNGEVTGNEWAASGVLFSTDGLALNIGFTSGSQPNSLGADGVTENDFEGNLTVQFTGGASYTDVFFTIFNTPFEASAYAADNTLLDTITSGLDFTQLFDFSGFAVNRIEISGIGYAIDDLNFSTAATVPEPSILALIGLGLAGLGIARTRKTSA